jgi:hypothetical protein
MYLFCNPPPPLGSIHPDTDTAVCSLNNAIEANNLGNAVTTIWQTVHQDYAVTFDKPYTDAHHVCVQSFWQKATKAESPPEARSCPTVSSLKFLLVPRRDHEGFFPIAALTACLKAHPLWADVKLYHNPYYAVSKDSDAYMSTVCVDVVDTCSGSVSHKLLNTSVEFYRTPHHCKPWMNTTPTHLCTICLQWGHTSHSCLSQSPCCACCTGAHLTEMHAVLCGVCQQGAACTNINCHNCGGNHEATSQNCKFWTACFGKDILAGLIANSKACGELQGLQMWRSRVRK